MAVFKKTAAMLCATTALILAMPAFSQDNASAEEESGGIEEIIVTAPSLNMMAAASA